MLETVILLSCLEATVMVDKIYGNRDIPPKIQVEIVREILFVSDCKDGNV